jgi:hypothetical protein
MMFCHFEGLMALGLEYNIFAKYFVFTTSAKT